MLFPRRPIFVPLIIAINTWVFVRWLLASTPAQLEFMSHHYLVSWTALQDGRYDTLLLAAFSHNIFLHFFLNMLVLNSFGSLLEGILGRRNFLLLYLLAAVLSSLSHSWVSAFLLDEPDLPALGASGAIAGVVLVFSLIFPRQPILLLGFIPMPAILGAVLFIGLDLWGLIAQTKGGGLPIGHGAHLGGAFTGIFFYFTYLRRRLRIAMRV